MTHTTKHTPGPWYVTASHELGYVVSDNGETIVPFGHHAGDMTPERWCNAHLIAAAPAMYEALRSIPDHALDCKHSYPHTLACWNCIVKAALAQAEGR